MNSSTTVAIITISSLLLFSPVAFVQCTAPPSWNWSGNNSNGSGGISNENERSPSLSFGTSRSKSSQYYEIQEEEEYNSYNNDNDCIPRNHLKGMGREFDLFSGNVLEKLSNHQASSGPRGGYTKNSNSVPPVDVNSSENPSSTYTPGRAGGNNRRRSRRRSSSSSRSGSSSRAYSSSSPQSQQQQTTSHFHNPFSSLLTWISDNQASIPRIQVKVEPNTTLKLRKRFRPLFKTLVTLGADFNTQRGVWQFRSSWEDSIIGGRLMLAGRELQLSKTWLLSVGAVEDLVTRLRFRAAIDLGTGKAYARFGFRTERLSPINVVEGFTLLRQLPLDGPEGHVKLEVKANFAFPEPEIEYSTEKEGRSLIGMGDIEVNLDELNLLLDY